MSYMDDRSEQIDLSIAASASDSVVTYLGSGKSLVGIDVPDDFEATTTGLLFTVGAAGTNTAPTMKPLLDPAGAAVTGSRVTVAASSSNRCVPLSPSNFVGWDFVRVTAVNASSSAVTQTAARTITGIVKVL